MPEKLDEKVVEKLLGDGIERNVSMAEQQGFIRRLSDEEKQNVVEIIRGAYLAILTDYKPCDSKYNPCCQVNYSKKDEESQEGC